MTSKKVGVSNAIVGNFDKIDGLPDDVKNTWAFEFNQTSNTISFQVQVGIPPMLIDNANQNLHTTIDVEDVDQLITFLATVKMNASKTKGSQST